MHRSSRLGRGAGRLALLAAIVFPALSQAQRVPPGFKCEVLFRPPEVEHPSTVTCDDDGNLCIGEDPMDMRGPSTKEFDRIQFGRWDPKGGKPRRTACCKNLSA